MRVKEIADRTGAVAQHKGRIFPRHVERFAVEQENPVFEPGHQRLNQYRIIMLRNLAYIFNQRGFAVYSLREIAARSRQRLDERGCAEPCKIFQRIFDLVSFGAMSAMPFMQKKILTAQCRNAAALEDDIGEVFVRGQRGGGGIVLRIPRTSPGAETDAFGL